MEVFVGIFAVVIIVVVVVVFLYKKKKIGGNRRSSTRTSATANPAENPRRYGLVKPEDQVPQPRRSTRTARDDPEVFVISQQRQQETRPAAQLPLQPRRARNPPQQRLTDEQIIGLDPPPSYEIAIIESEREREPQTEVR